MRRDVHVLGDTSAGSGWQNGSEAWMGWMLVVLGIAFAIATTLRGD
jgi:hypothetical protein